jgi:apolipoprotein N-acyltransferase
MALAGVGLFGNGLVFYIRTLIGGGFELGIGAEQIGTTVAEIQALSMGLHHYITHLHLGIAAFLLGSGIAIAALSWIGVRAGLRWSWWTAVLSFILIIGLGLPAHFPWDLDPVQHLGGAYLAIVLFVTGGVLTAPVARRVDG